MYVEAWACFIGKVPMPVYLSVGVEAAQLYEQLLQSLALCLCPRIGRSLTVSRESTDIAHPYAVGIVSVAMRPCDVHVAPLMNGTVTIDYIVVAYIRPALRDMPAANILHADIYARPCRRAMHNDFRYPSRRRPQDIPQQLLPGLCAHNPVSRQAVRRLKVFDRFLRQQPEPPIHLDVQEPLNDANLRATVANLANNRIIHFDLILIFDISEFRHLDISTLEIIYSEHSPRPRFDALDGL